MEREEVRVADSPKYTTWDGPAITTVSTTTAHDKKPYRPLGNWCWKTDSVRVDNGCLHCDWSMKLGPSWFCFYPREVLANDRD